VSFATATGAASDIVTSSAVIIGGVWAYFKFIRGRTFARRGELEAYLSLEGSGRHLHFVVTVKFKNTGLSKIPLNHDMTFLQVFGTTSRPGAAEWTEVSPLIRILDQHDWVEAQEPVTDTIVYSPQASGGTTSDLVAYKVEATVAAPRRRITGKGTTWQARSVAFLSGRHSRAHRTSWLQARKKPGG
jgi:hypothetical protein